MHGLVLAGVGIWCFLVAFAGGLVGLVLGNIRLPVMLLAGTSPAAAAGANIAVSGVAASAASVTHIRAGRVDWRLVCLDAAAVGARRGHRRARRLRASRQRAADRDRGGAARASASTCCGPDPAPVARPAGAGDNLRAAVISGFVIGVLGGLIGLILGSLRMPALIRWVGEEPMRAIGTNLVVGIAVGVAGLIGHLPGGIDWTLLWVGAAASIPGALIGSRLTGRLSVPQLLRAVGAILLVAGTASILQGIF